MMIRATHPYQTIAAVPYRGADEPTLGRTIERLRRCDHIDRIVVLHPADNPPPGLTSGNDLTFYPVHGPFEDVIRPARLAARRFSPTAWRGGIGGASVFDEVLAADATVAALDELGASAALLVGDDWPWVDPELCDAVIERHRQQPDALKLVFTQAPPGLCGCVVDRDLLVELRDKQSMIGSLLIYNPRIPQGDPIAKDPCVQIDPAVRDLRARCIADSPRWRRLLNHLDDDPALTAKQIAAQLTPHLPAVHHPLPQQVTIELNTMRLPTGPIVPQHHTAIERPPLDVDRAAELFAELADAPDIAVTLGGLGDPLLHPNWPDIVAAAREAGLSGLHIETDLIVPPDTLEALVEAHVDIISVRLNADSAPIYQQLMGGDFFEQVLSNIQWLLNHRTDGLPWIVPRMIKTADNVHELEGFFDRWMYFCGHAVVESPSTGRKPTPNESDTTNHLMPDLAVLSMAPPRRTPCRQLAHRMTIHSDGAVALCDQTWTDGQTGPLAGRWQQLGEVYENHQAQQFESLPCATCDQWHRP